MVSLNFLATASFVFAGALNACGGSTVSPEGSGGSAGTGGSTAGGSTSYACDVVGATVSQLAASDPAAVSCLKANCSANFSPCLGANYALGDFGTSPCAPYATCVGGCNCVGSCSNGCVVPTACISCLTNNVLACAVRNSCL